jgi:addiction module HigA family antidote
MPRVRTHPGEVLSEEFIVPLGLSARRVAEDIDVPANRLSEIIRGRRGVTADTAHRLAAYFDTTPQFWINLQVAHDLSEAEATHDYSSLRRRRVLEPAY